MIVIILSWIYYFILCFCIGLGVEKALARLLGRKWNFRMIDDLVAGIVAITLYAGFFSIVYKVGMAAHLLLLGIAAAVGFWNRKEVKKTFREGIRLCFSWEGFFFLCFLLLIAFFTSRGTFHTDTNIYHAQNIRLYEEYGLIKGMANLQLHYGYNSLYLAFAAIMSLSWLLPWSLHTTTGFIEAILCIYALHQLKEFRKHKQHLEDAGCVAILFYALVNLNGSMSPATDYPAMFLTIYMVAAYLRAVEKKAHYLVYGLLSLLAVFLGVMKLSAIAMVSVALYPAYYLIKEKQWKKIGLFVLLGMVILAPYLIRNVLISGWLIYPFEKIDLFHVPWKVPKEYLLVDSWQIKVWGRCLYDIGLIDMPVSAWLPVWWEEQERYHQMLIGGNILGVLLAGLNLIHKWIKKKEIRPELVILYLGMFVSLGVWFFLAPFVRYGLAFLLLIPAVSMASWLEDEKRGLHSILTGSLVFGIFLCMSPYMDHYVTDAGVFLKQQVKEPYYITAKDYDRGKTGSVELNGNIIYYCDEPDEGEINSYYDTPNTCYYFMLNRSMLAGDEIRDGFRPK